MSAISKGKNKLAVMSLLSASMVLTACGGGGGGSINGAPVVVDRDNSDGESNLPVAGSGFVDTGQSLGMDNSLAVALGDLDGDGDLDIVVANVGTGSRVYLNDGDGMGNFSDSGQLLGLGSIATTSITLGDIDGDGDLDILLPDARREVIAGVMTPLISSYDIYLNDGIGGFTDSGQLLELFTDTLAILGDIDGDGDLDVMLAGAGASGSSAIDGNLIYFNDGAGGFTDSVGWGGNDPNNAFARESLILGDIDNDGDLDVLVVNRGNAENQIFFNNGSGVFTDSNQPLDGNFFALGDVDNDGDLDVASVASLAFREPSSVYINDGAGRFMNSGEFGFDGGVSGVAFGDLDMDGDLDLVAASAFGSNSFFLNNGSGFDAARFLPLRDDLTSNFAIALGDLDGDGDLDIVLPELLLGDQGQGIRVFLNQ